MNENRGDGLILFAGIMLILMGIMDFFQGWWALRVANQGLPLNTPFYAGDFSAWAFIYMMAGIVVVLAGFAVFSRQEWGRWVGIIVAGMAAITNMWWIFAYPFTALVAVIIDVVIVYALVVYGGRQDAVVA